MALGGGHYITQNKVLPGTYHNFISAKRSFVELTDRGYVGLPIELDWGVEDKVFTVTSEDFQRNSRRIFGYDFTHPKLKGIRDAFKGAHTIHFYRLGEGGTKASNDLATAKYTGVRGNDITIVVQNNIDDTTKYNVQTLLDGVVVDEQLAVTDATELNDNDFVTFKDNDLSVSAGMPLTGGTNGVVTGGAHQEALDNLEAVGFNILGCLSAESTIKSLYIEYTKRLRDQVGVKFQLVGHKLGKADHEGVIDVINDAVGDREEIFGAVYWTVGAQAGVAVNKSNTNRVYTGEFTLDMSETKTQPQLTKLIRDGKYVFHHVGDETRVLEDINTFTSFTVDKNEDFSMNQVIRVIDQIAIDTSNLFNNRYLGKVPNDQDGRVSLWSEIVAHRGEMQRIRAIQDYSPDETTVEQGQSKKSVVVTEYITPTVAMSQLYITTVVA